MTASDGDDGGAASGEPGAAAGGARDASASDGRDGTAVRAEPAQRGLAVPGARGSGVRTAAAGLLVVAWLAAPVLAYGAMITATPFFGELPTPEEQRDASVLALSAAALAFGAPVLAWTLAGRGSALRVVAALEVTLAVVAVVVVGGMSLG